MQTTIIIKKIKVLKINREINITASPISGTFTVDAEYTVEIPTSIVDLGNINDLASSYKSLYPISRVIAANNSHYAVFRTTTKPIDIYKPNTTDILTEEDVQSILLTEYNACVNGLANFEPFPFDSILGKSLIDNTWSN
jgi:hypothetical protein